jgi:hypothetical protein
MVSFTQVVSELFDNIRYAWHERNAPYIDHEAINKNYEKNIRLYEEKMKSASEHLVDVDQRQYNQKKHIADEYLKTAVLLGRVDRLAKQINDNRDGIRGNLLSMITAYATSLGMAGGAAITVPSLYSDNSNLISQIAFFGFIFLFGLTSGAGILSQKRLNRIVKEQKDYRRYYKETTDLIEENGL